MEQETDGMKPSGSGTYAPENVSIYVVSDYEELADFLAEIRCREISESSIAKLSGIFNLIRTPVTVVCENGYPDKSYRDTYYAHFARKFTGLERDCKRLAFFLGELDPALFYRYDQGSEALLQDKFVGVCVLKPIRYGEIGRTVLNPKKLRLPKCYLRTAPFTFHVLGHTLTADAYPYSSQDTETMTCAEVSVWSILQYYGTRYSEYRTVLPSEIIRALEELSDERVIPSRGSEFAWMSSLFKKFGLSSRLYDQRAFGTGADCEREFKKLFHYYVESGIPLAVGISGRKKGETVRHSVVCIGHGNRRSPVKATDVNYMGNETVYPYIDSAFLYEDYVMMDDNRTPYQVEAMGKLSGWDESEMRTFAVPLNRYVFLEAGDVSVLINTILVDDYLGITNLIPEMRERVDQNNPLILRVFLAQSSSYRNFRAKCASCVPVAAFYSSIPLPEYVWVAEISTYASYQNRKIYGEIVIDATSGRNNYLDSLIMMRYLNHMGFRTPDEKSILPIDEGLKRRTKDLTFPYDMYSGNLMECGSDDL